MVCASTEPGFMWAVSSDRVAYVDASGDNWHRVSDLDLPGTQRISEAVLRMLLDPAYQSVAQVEQLLTATVGPSPGSIFPTGFYADLQDGACDHRSFALFGRWREIRIVHDPQS